MRTAWSTLFLLLLTALFVIAGGCSNPEPPPARSGVSSPPEAKTSAVTGVKTEETPSVPLPGTQESPAPAKVQHGRPEGLYFMTRYWISTHSLEKAVWYFSADGKVYQNLEHGFSEADLAAHKGPKGTYKRSEKELEIAWSDGKTAKSEVEIDKADPRCFMWDMGSFCPVSAFENAAAAAGTYEGGESLSGSGNSVIVSKTLKLGADGKFTWEGVSFVQGTTDQSTLSAGASGATTGNWTLDSYTITLTGSDGKTLRMIAFPYDDEKTPLKPDWMFFGGMMYRKQK